MYAHTPPQPSFGGAWCYTALCICPHPSSSVVIWWFETMAERSAYAPPQPLFGRAGCYAALCIRPRPSSSAVIWWFEAMAERSAHAPPPCPSSTVIWQSRVLRRALYARPGSTVNILYIHPLPFERCSLMVAVLCVCPPPSFRHCR